MYFEEEADESDPFEGFGDVEANDQASELDDEFEAAPRPDRAAVRRLSPVRIKTRFSWAGFTGGLAALAWAGAAVGVPLSYFGADGVLGLNPALQAGLAALAIGPALLFWLSASAAGEALKARGLAVELTRLARESRLPTEAGEADAFRLSATVRGEIESLNDAVASALDRMAELETAAHRKVAMFDDAVAASRENTAAMAHELTRECEALTALNSDLKTQTESVSHSIGRQIRLLRETSKLVKAEVGTAEDALENHLASFAAAASAMSDGTASFRHVANDAAATSASLSDTMTQMLEGLVEATRLTETARKAGEHAVSAANETASAVRDATRAAVVEAKRAAQLIHAETAAMHETAGVTLAKLQAAARSARTAAAEGQVVADRHAASFAQRPAARASAAGSKQAAARPERRADRAGLRSQEHVMQRETALQAAAAAAAIRAGTRPSTAARTPEAPRRAFKGFSGWSNFAPQREETPRAANESRSDLMEFSVEPHSPDAALKGAAVELVFMSGVDLDAVLQTSDLDRIARCSRDGAGARRRAVIDAAPSAVERISRRLKRDHSAHDLARRFHARPELAKSETRSEERDLVRAYLLIDAALA